MREFQILKEIFKNIVKKFKSEYLTAYPELEKFIH